jgi:arginine-tRNA-protein transferase
MLEQIRFSTAPYDCVYLPGQTAQLSYRIIREISDAEFDRMLSRGWRRFGIQFFRPNCPGCAGCRSLRIPVAQFVPSKSQRRVSRQNAGVRLEVRAPGVTAEHLRLWHEYHAWMTVQKGWPANVKTAQEYWFQFVCDGFSFAREFAYYVGERLVAVGLVDVTATSASSIYFYHDPALRSQALGVYSMLQEIEHAREHGLTHHYLGYWIPECPSSRYKGDYRPFELLTGFPREDEEPCWVQPSEWRPVLNREEHGLIME